MKSDGRDGDETEELSTGITSHLNKESSEMNDCAASENDSSSDIEASSVEDYVISDDVTKDFVSCDDVMISCDLGDGVAGDDVPNGGDATGVDVIDHGLLGDEVICDYDMNSDIVVSTGDYRNDIVASNERFDDCLQLDVNDHSPEGVEFDRNKNTDGVEMTHTEMSRTDSMEKHNKGDISTPYNEKYVVDTEGNSSLRNNHAVADIQEKQTDNKKDCNKEKTDSGKCFIEIDKASVKNRRRPDDCENTSVGLEKMSLPNTNKTNENESFESNSSLSITIQHGCTRCDEGINFPKDLDTSSFLSTTPLPPSATNTAKQSAFGKTNAQDNLNESSNDSSVSLKSNTNTISSPQDISSQSGGDKVNDSIDYGDKSMNITVDYGIIDKGKNSGEIDDSESLTKIDLSKVEARSSSNSSSNGIIDRNIVQQKHTNSDTPDESNMISSNANLRNVEDQTCYNTDSDTSEKEISRKYTNTSGVENLQFFNDAEIQKMEDTVSHISDNDSEQEFSNSPFIKRPSSSNSITSSDISELEEKSSITEQQGEALVNNGVDLSSKKGMDKFKEFLVNTKGEALFLFWLQVETWKHIGDHGDKIR